MQSLYLRSLNVNDLKEDIQRDSNRKALLGLGGPVSGLWLVLDRCEVLVIYRGPRMQRDQVR